MWLCDKCPEIITKQRCVHRSKTCCQTLKHFDNVIFTCCENVVEVFESLTTKFWMMDTRTITFNVILTITNAISINLPSGSTKCFPIMTYIHHWKCYFSFENSIHANANLLQNVPGQGNQIQTSCNSAIPHNAGNVSNVAQFNHLMEATNRNIMSNISNHNCNVISTFI
jgi:hypothetical protein